MGLPILVAALGLMLLGGGTVGLGARGFSEDGLPVGGGRRLRGRAGKLVGVLLIWLGMFLFVATAAALLSLG